MVFRGLKSRRGQTELIGLVVIVIMLTLGMLFLAKFALQEEPEKKIFTRKGLAYSTMSAVMKTELECFDVPGSNDPNEYEVQADLLKDCANVRLVGGGTIHCSGYIDSCDVLENEITLLLNSTLDEWHKNYVFRSEVLQPSGPETLIEIDNGGCGGSAERDSSGLFPIYVKNVGLIESILYVCD